MCVYNNPEHTNYSSIDDLLDGISFRDSAQYILDLGAQGAWGEREVREYAYTGPGSSYHPANDVQAVMVDELNITREKYELTVKKADSSGRCQRHIKTLFFAGQHTGVYSSMYRAICRLETGQVLIYQCHARLINIILHKIEGLGAT